MTATELLAKFADPQAMQQLASSDKLNAGLVTTILGMGITFVALLILMVLISWFDKLINPKRVQETTVAKPSAQQATPTAAPEKGDDRELVAAITTALAITLKTPVDNIVIRNIVRVEDKSPAWNRAGIIEQMNSRL